MEFGQYCVIIMDVFDCMESVCWNVVLVFGLLVNDECDGGVDFGLVLFCDGMVYINIGVILSFVGFDDVLSCFDSGMVWYDVFFLFIVEFGVIDVNINIIGVIDGFNGVSIINLQMVIYWGDCNDLIELVCVIVLDGVISFSLDLVGLMFG